MCEVLRVGLFNWDGAEHDVGGADTPSASPTFRRAPRSSPECRRARVPQPVGASPINGNEGIAAASPQPARPKPAPKTSGDLLANNQGASVVRIHTETR